MAGMVAGIIDRLVLLELLDCAVDALRHGDLADAVGRGNILILLRCDSSAAVLDC
jgi:hypothetical protein